MASEEAAKGNGEDSGNYINSFMSFIESDKPPNKDITDDTNKNSEESEVNETPTTEVDFNHSTNNKDVEMSTEETDGKEQEEMTEESKDENSNNGENKDSDVMGQSDGESRSSFSANRRNVARRGKKRKHTDLAPQRETPRRAARKIKSYIDDNFHDISDVVGPDDPDYHFSDSDDDPDFDPSKKKALGGSPELDLRKRRSSKGKAAKAPSVNRQFRKSVENTDEDSVAAKSGGEEENNDSSMNNENNIQKRRGRPPTYASSTNTTTTTEISDNTVSSTDDTKTAGKLSSAYNYASTRTRQNQAIRLPEGPNLTDEQLKLIESQFKSGDFVMAKKDTDMMEHPPIWRIDGKSLLQKFQAFEKDGKMLYRNISTYSGWTSQAKALYVPVKVKFVFQSRYDTVVELVGLKDDDNENNEPSPVMDKPVWLSKNKDFEISDELREHMSSFEIYLQTLISQALDNNFLQEIYEENDSYFVDRVKIIDELTEERKKKILTMAKWDEKFQSSLDTWPCVNTMITKNISKCQACSSKEATMLSQFYGQPYDQKTLHSKEPTVWDLDHKNFETCESCSTLSQLYNKVAHQKYDYYSQCKSTVTNIRVSQPNKTTTNVLRDLLANDEWITGLFRSMCTTWIKVDNLKIEKETENDNCGETTDIQLVDCDDTCSSTKEIST